MTTSKSNYDVRLAALEFVLGNVGQMATDQMEQVQFTLGQTLTIAAMAAFNSAHPGGQDRSHVKTLNSFNAQFEQPVSDNIARQQIYGSIIAKYLITGVRPTKILAATNKKVMHFTDSGGEWFHPHLMRPQPPREGSDWRPDAVRIAEPFVGDIGLMSARAVRDQIARAIKSIGGK